MSITTERGTIPIHEDMITVPAAGKIARIGQRIGEYQTIGQAAEEAAKLSAALSKYRRKLEAKNPSPKSLQDCQDNVIEEMADTEVALLAAGFCFGFGGVKEIEIRKVDRWYKRVFGGDADGKVQP